MADEAGAALIAQQKFAAEEPFKDIEENRKNLQLGLNAFQISANAGKARQQLENQLQIMTMRQQQMEADRELKEREFGIRTAQTAMSYGLREQAMQNALTHQGQMYDLAKTRADNDSEYKTGMYNIALSAESRKADKISDTSDAVQAALGVDPSLARDGITPDMPNYFAEHQSRLSAIPNLPTSLADRQTAIAATIVNNTANTMDRAYKAKLQSFKDDYSNTVFGTKAVTDLKPLLQPESYPDQPAPKTWNWSNWSYDVGEPTGNKLIQMYSQGKPVGKPRAVSSQSLTDFNKRWNDLQTEAQRIPPRQDIPTLGVYSQPANTLRDRAIRIKNDPNTTSQAKAAAEQYLNNNP